MHLIPILLCLLNVPRTNYTLNKQYSKSVTIETVSVNWEVRKTRPKVDYPVNLINK